MTEQRVYSNIGFRSESLIEELKKYKAGERTNPLVINDAYSIIKRFDRILLEPNFHLNNPDKGAYLQLIFEEMKAKKITTIQIKTTKITLEKMLKDKKISEDEIRIGLNFFKEISAKCREYATEPSCHN